MAKKQGKIFITGCSGFIGGAITREAIRQGYSVTGLDIRECRIAGIKFIKGDIRNYVIVRKAIKGADYVMHLAAITSNLEFERNMYDSYSTNVSGFINVISASKSEGCKAFVYASSAATYTSDNGFSESSLIDIKKQRSHYAKTKLIDEMIADSYSDMCKMRITGLRYFNVYGPGENQKGEYASVITRFINMDKSKKSITIYGNGKQARDIIYIDDVAKISLMLLRNGTESTYNVGTGRATSYISIANMINPKNKKFVSNPLSSYQHFTQADTKRLLSKIGKFKFTPVSKGINKTADASR